MTMPASTRGNIRFGLFRILRQIAGTLALALLAFGSNSAFAQGDIRYSYFEISYVGQDVDRSGTRTDSILQQTVDLNATDGNGIKFQASLGTWHNLYAFMSLSSSDIDVLGVVTNPGGSFPGQDEFDFTSFRGGVGIKIPLRIGTDLYGEISYDSLDLDFGSFAGENFDTDSQDFGAAFGIRTLIKDKLELRAYARYSNVGDVDLNAARGTFEDDTLFGVGAGYELVRGLSITADFESGEFTNWNVGFRLDLDEK
jgi:hypothetical protein